MYYMLLVIDNLKSNSSRLSPMVAQKFNQQNVSERKTLKIVLQIQDYAVLVSSNQHFTLRGGKF